ncbi:MAG: coproporphyrinogen III oxidase family protein [Treponema sp.]|nr:coproporphyrinogen III oxidase family protein [Treponema sp.]
MGICASLYIHVPFCAGACDYCDFYSLAVNPALPETQRRMDAFVDALLADVEDQLEAFAVEEVPTLYVGGGTPSLLGAARAGRLLAGLGALLPRRPAECTVEANPESADEDFLRVCRDGGVNRISLGVQSFHAASRRAVRRVGHDSSLEERLALVSRYYPLAFSADLIAALPFQTGAVLRRDIERLLAFDPCHVSLYSLTVEPGTPLAGRAVLPAADEADALWLAGRDALETAGFEQYEVSNFALPGRECVHNIRYWRMENWLGAGPAASGTLIDDRSGTGTRRAYPPDLDVYLAASRPAVQTAARAGELDRTALIKESLLMGFRYRNGPDRDLFRRRFSRSIEECIPQTIARWEKRGFFRQAPTGLAPSRRGLLFLDAFLRDAFAELG